MSTKWWVWGFLTMVVAVVLVMTFRYAFSGPTFRAEDHASYEECIAGIPREWGLGSLERSGAETACRYVHQSPAR